MIPLQSAISSKCTGTSKFLPAWISLVFLILVLPNPRAHADLIIESFRIADALGTDTTQFASGETFQINTSIWNKGRARSSETTLRYYLSADTDISPDDTEVATDRVKPLRGRGAYSPRRRTELSKTLTVPDRPGTYYYGVCVDAIKGTADIRDNCSQSIAITVETPASAPEEPQGPDLIFSMARVERNIIKLGWGVKIHLTVRNQGTATASATMLRFYRSTDPMISAEDTELRAVRISQLGPGRRMTTWAPLLGPTALGVFYYGVCIDGVASEFDTSNNCSAAFEITVEPQSGGTPVLVPVGMIPTQVLGIKGRPMVIDVANNFIGNVKRYTTRSSEPQVVSVSVSKSKLTLTPRDKGWAQVTVTAFSGDLAAKHTFFASIGGAELPNLRDLSPEVSIPDAGLRTTVRTALELQADAPITQQKMAGLIQLDAAQREIQDLTGLEYAVSLKHLVLNDNEISDLASLASLTTLTRLQLNNNQITDVSALENLTSLMYLFLSGNSITDMEPLRKLKQKNPNLNTDIDIDSAPAPSIPMLPFGNGVEMSATSNTEVPTEVALLPNYPNPFNPETWIPYQLATDTNVRITIYNAKGVVVQTLTLGHQSAGYYTGRNRAAYWDGQNALGERVASGFYFYQLETDTVSVMHKMVILK